MIQYDALNNFFTKDSQIKFKLEDSYIKILLDFIRNYQ